MSARIKFAARILLPLLSIFLFAFPAWSQSAPLSLGSYTPFVSSACNQGTNNPLPEAVCYSTTISGCSNHGFPGDPTTVPDITANIAISTPPNWNGSVIFLHDGNLGEDYFGEGQNCPGPSCLSYAKDYYNNGFRVVQIIWVGQGWQNASGESVEVLKYDACRPATLLNAVYTNSVSGPNTTGAMCAQGHSAGSAAVAYTLAWYGADKYLSSVVLTSGPVYGNVEAGCQYPASQQFKNPITVCPTGQFGCMDGSPGSWTDFTQYTTPQPAEAVSGYTIPGSNCNNWDPALGNTTTTQNQDWGGMSVASTGANYSYPTTRLYAFLCATTLSGTGSQNNSAGQGQQFYKNIVSGAPPLDYAVYRVDQCKGPEEIWFGTAPGAGGEQAFNLSAGKMIAGCIKQ